MLRCEGATDDDRDDGASDDERECAAEEGLDRLCRLEWISGGNSGRSSTAASRVLLQLRYAGRPSDGARRLAADEDSVTRDGRCSSSLVMTQGESYRPRRAGIDTFLVA